MSKGKLYLVSTLTSLLVCLILSEPAGAHESKWGKFKLKDSSAKESCSLESPHSWLGLLVQDLNPNRVVAQDVEAGALVVQVVEGGPAEAVGVKQGDVIIALNDQPVASAQQLSDLVAKLPAGTKARLTLISNGKQENKILPLAKPKFTLRQKHDKPMPQAYPGMFMEEMMSRTPMKQMKGGAPVPGTRFSPPTQEHIVIKPQERDYIQLYLRHQDTLGLNLEQVKELEHLAREQRKYNIRIDAEIEIAKIELEELMHEGKINLDKVEQKIKQLQAALGEKLLSQVKTLYYAQALMTDEQRARLKELRLN